ncbi:MAG: AI-2E family transporter [Verrucomicrobiales bacterium]|nr:AI-2E family transporter [Verrucomicrobiales bacterium]
MTGRKQAGSGIRVLLSLASVIVVVAGLKSAAELFIPIMLGFFLALLSLPILNWLDRRGFPRPLAVLTTVFVDLLILGFIVFLAFSVLGDFQKKTKGYAELLRDRAATFSVEMDAQFQRFGNFWDQTPDRDGETTPKSESIADPEVAVETVGDAPKVDGASADGSEPNQSFDLGTLSFKDLVDDYFDTNRVVAFIAQFDVVSRFTTLATQSFFALIVMIFVLAESGSYAHKVHDVLHVRGPDLSRFQNTSQDIQKYLGIKTAVSFATGLLATLVCVIFRIEFPLLWGLVAFLFNYVPAIGSIVAAIPPTLLALISNGFWWAAGLLSLYLIINVAIGNFLEPMLLGDRFGISTVIVILSVLFWGYVWGPVGMLLAVPLTMMVKVMLDNSSDLRWISAFMGKGIGVPHSSEADAEGVSSDEAADI